DAREHTAAVRVLSAAHQIEAHAVQRGGLGLQLRIGGGGLVGGRFCGGRRGLLGGGGRLLGGGRRRVLCDRGGGDQSEPDQSSDRHGHPPRGTHYPTRRPPR